ncbi:spike base protein, RCAP_Rcc01079 family [Roseovarius indicus]|jgi:hypothetical protein|uniref:spike base protein, RCAP_Rcc01079 family n=1 Tax=Roseovarius indicus TaxID=540747 RepID=UPI003513634F
MSDPFTNHTPGLEFPSTGAILIAPNNGAELTTVTHALNVGTVGSVLVTMLDGLNIMVNITAGVVFPIRVTGVRKQARARNIFLS